MDVLKVMMFLNSTIASMEEQRDNSVHHFKQLCINSEDFPTETRIDIKKSRVTEFNKNRSNMQSHSVEEYFRTGV